MQKSDLLKNAQACNVRTTNSCCGGRAYHVQAYFFSGIGLPSESVAPSAFTLAARFAVAAPTTVDAPPAPRADDVVAAPWSGSRGGTQNSCAQKHDIMGRVVEPLELSRNATQDMTSHPSRWLTCCNASAPSPSSCALAGSRVAGVPRPSSAARASSAQLKLKSISVVVAHVKSVGNLGNFGLNFVGII